MKISSSKSALYFLLAGIFSLSAQSFLLVPQRQATLLDGLSDSLILLFSAALLLGAYLNLALTFYQHARLQRSLIALFSAIFLVGFVFQYARGGFWVEATLFFCLLLALLGETWNDNTLWLEGLGALANGLIGAGLISYPEQFLQNAIYQRVSVIQDIFGFLFLGAALFWVLGFLRPFQSLRPLAAKSNALPWIGWALLFSAAPVLSVEIPAIAFSVTLLALGLLPFEKFRLPDNKMLGSNLFPTFSICFGILLAIFFYFVALYPSPNIAVGDILFIFSASMSILCVYGVMRLHYLLHLLTAQNILEDDLISQKNAFGKFVELLFAPMQELQPLSQWQAEKIKQLSAHLAQEKRNVNRYTMLNALRSALDNQLDDPVAAQLVVNTIEQYFGAGIVGILLYDIEERELSALAVAGKQKDYIPPNYSQSIDEGILGRAARSQKVQIVRDTTLDEDYMNLRGEKIASEVALPLTHHGHLKGVFLVGMAEKDAFSAADIRILEATAKELLKAWERSGHESRMTALIQSSIALSTSLDPQNAIQELTLVARETLQARFVFVTLLDQEGTFSRTASAGYAPNLHAFLSQDLDKNVLLQVALKAKAPVRVRDIRHYEYAPSITLDHNMLRGLIMIPIRLHGVSVGAVLGFGKQGGIFFSEKDESLANLLATQAAAAVESAWLIQELRSTTVTTAALYQLSVGIIQTDNIREGARFIAATAQSLSNAYSAGIVLFSLDQKIQIALEVTADGIAVGRTVPLDYIEQTLATGEVITISSGDSGAFIYLPVQTSLRKYGVLWVGFSDNERQAASQAQTLKTLANQAAMALERTMLLIDLRQKAIELKGAYRKLENTYDQTLSALTSALDARDRETEGHSSRVGNIACGLGEALGLSADEIVILRRGALLHDIGKIGINDGILHKPGLLTNDEWRIMRQHPDIGARIVQGIPFLEDTMPIILHHHERWNGSGYPHALRGEDIPLMARIFAIADVFDALTSIRPYRESSSHEEAFSYLQKNAGILFDPKIVTVFERLLRDGEIEKMMRN